LGIWLFLVHINIRVARALESHLGTELKSALEQCKKIDSLETQRTELIAREKMFAKLGAHVDAARLIRALDQAMPREVALTGLQMDLEESLPAQNNMQTRLVAPEGEVAVNHLLRVKVQGLAPTDVDVGNLMSQLGKMKFIDQVAITYSRDHADKGHLMREFELTFVIDLSLPPDQ